MKFYIVYTHLNPTIKAILMRTINIRFCLKIEKEILKLLSFASGPGVMLNSQWLKLPVSRTNVRGPKGMQAIEHEIQQTSKSLRVFKLKQCRFNVLMANQC